MKTVKFVSILAFLVVSFFPGMALAQSDPGVRPGAINGQPGATPTSPLPLASVAANNPAGSLEFFQNGLTRFQDIDPSRTVPPATMVWDHGLTLTSAPGAIRSRQSGAQAPPQIPSPK